MASKNNLKRFYMDVETLRSDLYEFNKKIGRKELWQWNIASAIFLILFVISIAIVIMSSIAIFNCGILRWF